jgi:hypothetical protein
VPKPGQEPRGWRAAATRLCQKIVGEAALGVLLPEAERDWLVRLFEARHPTWGYKGAGRVTGIRVQNNPDPRRRHRQLVLVQAIRPDEPVSWLKCISPPDHESKCKEAMRRAIEPQIIAYRGSVPARCELCTVISTRLEVDHFPVTFAELVAGYAEAVGGWDAIEVDTEWTGDYVEGSQLGAMDKKVWSLYHCRYASLRLLCGVCHR